MERKKIFAKKFIPAQALPHLLVFIIIFTWVFSGWPRIWQNPPIPPKIERARAATTGAKYPTLGETSSEAPWSDNDWTTATNIYADDAATANVTAASFDSPDQTYVLKATGFDFSAIPDGSTINGIIVRTNSWYRSGQGSGSIDLCQLLDTSKAKVGTNQCATPVALTTTNTTVIEKGSSTDLWGNALTTTWVKSANFGVAIGILATGANADVDVDYVTIEIYYTPPVAPTVTTQAASVVEATTATGNGNITATGGANATAWGVCYKISTGCTTADSVAAGSGTGGVGAFTASLASLSPGTTYYIKAYATNSAGTSYGSEVTILTKPAAPTTVVASDGAYTDKVAITWTKSTGATGYRVYRDAVDVSGLLGDVAVYDDTGAGAPTITVGTAVATDGTATDKVTLSSVGASANNGATHTYKVVASNATGNSADSLTDTGYRGVGPLTFQWQSSAADSDATYSNIIGATSVVYNETAAPAPTVTAGTASATDGSLTDRVTLSIAGAAANNGAGRYYKAVLNATGAIQQITAADRGYRGVGPLTYQWNKSSGDADLGYSALPGATTAPYDDTTAPAPTITPGAASASDGTSLSYVALSVSGQSASAGAGRYFYATVSAAGAASADTNHDRGYMGVGPLTYQWQRSAADSNATYSNIIGATTASYNDTAAPSDGSGRYYQLVENAAGAAQQISTADRGYRIAPIISVTLDRTSFSYGTIDSNTASSTLPLWNGAGIVATNNGNVTEDFDIYGANTTGTGAGWTLAANTTGNNYVHQFCNDTDSVCTTPPTNYTALTTSPIALKSLVASAGTVAFQLRLTAPAAPADFSQQSATVTVLASQSP